MSSTLTPRVQTSGQQNRATLLSVARASRGRHAQRGMCTPLTRGVAPLDAASGPPPPGSGRRRRPAAAVDGGSTRHSGSGDQLDSRGFRGPQASHSSRTLRLEPIGRGRGDPATTPSASCAGSGVVSRSSRFDEGGLGTVLHSVRPRLDRLDDRWSTRRPASGGGTARHHQGPSAGRVRVNTAPFPGPALAAVSVPPCARAIARLIDRPMPVPPASLDRAASVR